MYLLGAAFTLAAASAVAATKVWEQNLVNGWIEEAIFSEDGNRVACRLADGRVRLSGSHGSGANQIFSTSPYAVTQVALSADGGTAVWADTSGRVHSYSNSNGMKTVALTDDALTGLVLSRDGAVLSVAGSGTTAWLRNGSDLSARATRNIGLEQVRALGANTDGSIFLAADHGGRLRLYNRDSATIRNGSLTGESPVGIRYIGRPEMEWVVWHAEGTISLLNDNLGLVDRIETGWTEISACLVDADSGVLVLGNLNGGINVLDLGKGVLAATPLVNFPSGVAGLGMNADGALLAMTQYGAVYAQTESGFEPIGESIVDGHVMRASASLQAGVGTVLTNAGAWQFDLASGESKPLATAANEIVLDADVFHGLSGSGSVQLLLVRESKALSLAGDGLAERYPIEGDWTPTRILCAPFGPRIALMSATGEARILEEQPDGMVEVFHLQAAPDGIWRNFRFAENQAVLLRTEGVPEGDLIAQDGPFQFAMDAAGALSFARIDTDPAIMVWPDLMPAAGGGMDSGYLGNVRAIRHSWFFHREFGWGWMVPQQEVSWYWFAKEGWLAGRPLTGNYLYAYDSGNWLYALASIYPTDWIYDFATNGWRRFGE